MHGMYSPLVMFCLTFKRFWLWLIVFEPMICLNDVFLRKAVIGVALNTFPNLLLISNICQCLLINFLEFGKIGLYVTKNGITIFRTTLVCLTELISPDCRLFRFGFKWWFLCTLFSQIVLPNYLNAFCI